MFILIHLVVFDLFFFHPPSPSKGHIQNIIQKLQRLKMHISYISVVLKVSLLFEDICFNVCHC